MDKKSLLELLGDNQFDQLFAALLTRIESEEREDLEATYYALEGRYHQWKRHQAAGTRREETIAVEGAQLRESLISLIKQLDQPPPSKIKKAAARVWFWPLIIGIICMVLIGLGSLKTPSIDFELEANTRYLAFRLEQDWDLETDLLIDYFEAFPVHSAIIDTLSWTAETHGELELQLENGRTQLAHFPVKSGSALSFTLDQNEIIGQLYDSDSQFSFSLEGTTLLLPDLGYENYFGDTATAGILTVQTGEAPEFSFIPIDDSGFSFKNKLISGLDFQQKSREPDQSLTSAINTGTITIRGIQTDLADRPFLDFIEPEATTLTLQKSGDTFLVKVLGSAKDLQIGATPANQQSVKPTIIEYLAKNERANVFWNAIVLIVGVLWGLGKVFRKGEKDEKGKKG